MQLHVKVKYNSQRRQDGLSCLLGSLSKWKPKLQVMKCKAILESFTNLIKNLDKSHYPMDLFTFSRHFRTSYANKQSSSADHRTDRFVGALSSQLCIDCSSQFKTDKVINCRLNFALRYAREPCNTGPPCRAAVTSKCLTQRFLHLLPQWLTPNQIYCNSSGLE